VTVIFVPVSEKNLKWLDYFSCNCPMSNSTQISSAVLALFYKRTDGRTKQS